MLVPSLNVAKFLQTYFSMLSWHAHLPECNILLDSYLAEAIWTNCKGNWV